MLYTVCPRGRGNFCIVSILCKLDKTSCTFTKGYFKTIQRAIISKIIQLQHKLFTVDTVEKTRGIVCLYIVTERLLVEFVSDVNTQFLCLISCAFNYFPMVYKMVAQKGFARVEW